MQHRQEGEEDFIHLFRSVLSNIPLKNRVFKYVKEINYITTTRENTPCKCIWEGYNLSKVISKIGRFKMDRPHFDIHLQCKQVDDEMIDLCSCKPIEKETDPEPINHEYIRYPRTIPYKLLTFDWCCRYGTPSLLFSLCINLQKKLIELESDNNSINNNDNNNDNNDNNNNDDSDNENSDSQQYIQVKFILKEVESQYNQLIESALTYGNIDMVRYLIQLKKECQYSEYIPKYDVNQSVDFDKQIMIDGLWSAMKFGHIELLSTLLQYDKNLIGPYLYHASYSVEELVKSILVTYSGCRFECLEDTLHCRWKTTKEITLDSLPIDTFPKFKTIPQCPKDTHSVIEIKVTKIELVDNPHGIKRQKDINGESNSINNNNNQPQTFKKIFPVSTSKYYIAMYMVCNHIAWKCHQKQITLDIKYNLLRDSELDHILKEKVYRNEKDAYFEYAASNCTLLGGIHQDSQGINFLNQLGIKTRYKVVTCEKGDLNCDNIDDGLILDEIVETNSMNRILDHVKQNGLTFMSQVVLFEWLFSCKLGGGNKDEIDYFIKLSEEDIRIRNCIYEVVPSMSKDILLYLYEKNVFQRQETNSIPYQIENIIKVNGNVLGLFGYNQVELDSLKLIQQIYYREIAVGSPLEIPKHLDWDFITFLGSLFMFFNWIPTKIKGMVNGYNPNTLASAFLYHIIDLDKLDILQYLFLYDDKSFSLSGYQKNKDSHEEDDHIVFKLLIHSLDNTRIFDYIYENHDLNSEYGCGNFTFDIINHSKYRSMEDYRSVCLGSPYSPNIDNCILLNDMGFDNIDGSEDINRCRLFTIQNYIVKYYYKYIYQKDSDNKSDD